MNIGDREAAVYAALDAMASDPDVTDEEYEESLIGIAESCQRSAANVHAERRF